MKSGYVRFVVDIRCIVRIVLVAGPNGMTSEATEGKRGGGAERRGGLAWRLGRAVAKAEAPGAVNGEFNHGLHRLHGWARIFVTLESGLSIRSQRRPRRPRSGKFAGRTGVPVVPGITQ